MDSQKRLVYISLPKFSLYNKYSFLIQIPYLCRKLWNIVWEKNLFQKIVIISEPTKNLSFFFKKKSWLYYLWMFTHHPSIVVFSLVFSSIEPKKELNLVFLSVAELLPLRDSACLPAETMDPCFIFFRKNGELIFRVFF